LDTGGPAAHSIQGAMQSFNFTHLLAYGIMRGGKIKWGHVTWFVMAASSSIYHSVS